MRTALQLHPDFTCPFVSRLEVEVVRGAAGELRLVYLLTGDVKQLRLAPPASPERTDGLWQETCFEAFVAGETGDQYVELNFSPSTRWAAYAFDSYRNGKRDLKVEAPLVELERGAESLELRATCRLADDLPGEGAWRLALSAVIEEANGRKSYWAAAHPAGKADFHHRDGFVLQLPSAA